MWVVLYPSGGDFIWTPHGRWFLIGLRHTAPFSLWNIHINQLDSQGGHIFQILGKRYDNDEVVGWCVDTTLGAGAGAYYTLRMGTCFFVRYKVTVLNMAARWHSCAVCFSPWCGIRLDGVVFWRTFVRLAHACITKFSGKTLGTGISTGNISINSELHFEAVLGM